MLAFKLAPVIGAVLVAAVKVTPLLIKRRRERRDEDVRCLRETGRVCRWRRRRRSRRRR